MVILEAAATLEDFVAALPITDSRTSDTVTLPGIMVAVRSIMGTMGTTGITVHLDYGLDNYDGYPYPYYDNDDYFDAQSTPSGIAPQESTMSVQRELTQLGYYRGPIDGIVGSKTEQAIRWFQSVDKLPVTGQIDSATLQALRIG